MAFFIEAYVMDEFKWRTQVQDSPVGEFRHRVREVVFGDGYKQVAGMALTPNRSHGPLPIQG